MGSGAATQTFVCLIDRQPTALHANMCISDKNATT